MSENHCHCHADHDAEQGTGSVYEQAFANFDLHLHDEAVSEAVHQLVEKHQAQYNTLEVKKQLLQHG